MWNIFKKSRSPVTVTLDSQIEASIKRVEALLKKLTKEKAHVSYFGATYIDPRYLSVWLCVQSDVECARLEADLPNIREQVHACLKAENYPPQAIPRTVVSVASQETVTRDYEGNWWYFFK